MGTDYCLLYCESKPGSELFSQSIIASLLSNQESGFSNLGFKIHAFNSQFLTQTDISFFRPTPKMAISRFTLKSPVSWSNQSITTYWFEYATWTLRLLGWTIFAGRKIRRLLGWWMPWGRSGSRWHLLMTHFRSKVKIRDCQLLRRIIVYFYFVVSSQ